MCCITHVSHFLHNMSFAKKLRSGGVCASLCPNVYVSVCLCACVSCKVKLFQHIVILFVSFQLHSFYPYISNGSLHRQMGILRCVEEGWCVGDSFPF